MIYFIKSETISTLERTSLKDAKAPRKERGTFMKKNTLLKIIREVRNLEIKMSKNDSQFKFYNKKKKRIEHKRERLRIEYNNLLMGNYDFDNLNESEIKAIKEKVEKAGKEEIDYFKQTKETLNFCYSFMDKVEKENKAINNQIKQYLTNYILITLVEKLNKEKTFNYKKLDKIIDEISTETNKIHNFKNYNYNVLYKSYDFIKSIYLRLDYNNDIMIIYDCVKYFESHLTKKSITKKFSIDDFKDFINWDIKTPEQEVQDNATTENELNALKSKIEKLISDYNQEREKLTINQNNYKYMYMRQD